MDSTIEQNLSSADSKDVKVEQKNVSKCAAFEKVIARFIRMLFIVVYFYSAPFLIFILNWKNTFFAK